MNWERLINRVGSLILMVLLAMVLTWLLDRWRTYSGLGNGYHFSPSRG